MLLKQIISLCVVLQAEPLEDTITPELSVSLSSPGAHTPGPGGTPVPQSPASPTSSSVPAPPPSAALIPEDPLRASAFVSCDHNYTVEDMVQQKKRVELLVEQLNKLRRKLKTLRQKCRRQERQLRRFRATEEISESRRDLELGQSYVILPRELLTTLKGIHAIEGL